jgi:hypothetical protein
VFEHRNYFASLGVCLVLVDVLLLWPVAGLGRTVGTLVAACALLAFGATTHLRAREWRDALTFAHVEAQKRCPDGDAGKLALRPAQVFNRRQHR